MKKNNIPFSFIWILIFSLFSCSHPNISRSEYLNIDAEIFPEYSSITIPINCAPINFQIKDLADDYYVSITSDMNKEISVRSKSGLINIPIKKWKQFIKINKGKSFEIKVHLKKEGSWYTLNSIKNKIAKDSIDSFLVYRFINPANILWSEMGIYQRNLENFEVHPIMANTLTDNNCMHCHSFAANNSENFMLHMRGKPGGTVIYNKGQLSFVDTKTEHTISAGGYPAWHPSGDFIAFSNNKINQKFHAKKEKYTFVYDQVSDIVIYDVSKNEISAIPKLSTPDFENLPTWSPDGNYLYFISCKPHTPNSTNYENIKYSLKRISFKKNNNTWGEVETIIDAEEVGKSISFPRVSPDNRYVAFCLADYGYFTVYNETSDICVFDLVKNEIIKLDINSSDVESYPSWSKNGKWLMFNSKRLDGVTSRPYFSHFDNGIANKPFILPQKNPNWNIYEINNINRPELVASRVDLSPQQILKLVSKSPEKSSFNMDSKINKKDVKLPTSTESYDSFNFDQ